MKWIKDTFIDLDDVTIEDYDQIPYGKKVTDNSNDYVIIYYDNQKEAVKFLFKEE